MHLLVYWILQCIPAPRMHYSYPFTGICTAIPEISCIALALYQHLHCNPDDSMHCTGLFSQILRRKSSINHDSNS